MRKRLLSPVLCLALLLCLFSCSKKNGDVPAPTDPVQPDYGKTLSKIYELDTTKQAPNDTVGRWVFTYDNSKRVLTTVFTSTAIYRNDVYTGTRTIEYKGSDTLAFRSVKKESTSSFTNIDTTTYTFANGRYAGDTVSYDYGATQPRGTSKTTFDYQAGTVTRNFQNWVPQWSYSATERQVIHQTVAAENITHQIDTTYSVTNGQAQLPQTYETTVAYLPNPNPFFKLFSPVQRAYFGPGEMGIGNLRGSQYAPKNLVSQQTSTSGSVTYDYTFRTDGYPLTARVAVNAGGTKTVTKLLFVYALN